MSEAELHVLKARLRGGILNKVRRGEYRCPLPTGFVYDEAGNVVLDPDSQVRETISYFFETFSRVGSASQTVKVFRNEGLCFRLCFAKDISQSSSRLPHRPRCARCTTRVTQVFMCTAGGAIGGAPMGLRNCELVNAMIGSRAFRTLTRATLAGSNFSRISRFSRPTVVGSTSRALRRHERELRYCRAALCAVDAAGTSAFDTLRGVEGSKHGISVIARAAAVVNRTASLLLGAPSTKQSVR